MADAFNCQLLPFTLKSNFLLVVCSLRFTLLMDFFFPEAHSSMLLLNSVTGFPLSSQNYLVLTSVNGLINSASNLSVNVTLLMISKTGWSNDTKITNLLHFLVLAKTNLESQAGKNTLANNH